jgi:hypothetical protein
MGAIAFRAFCLFFFAGLSGSCATVDQYGSRAYDGNLNTQNAINQEVLVNIIRASRYQAVSWNPASQITGGQAETLTTGLPTINFGPGATAASQIYSITNSVSSGVTGGYTTAPLATTAFQAGMLTPVDLKTLASLATYYPRDAVFFALIAAIDVKLVSSDRVYGRLINDPSAAYYDANYASDLDQTRCNELLNELRQHPGPEAFFNPPYPATAPQCSYEKFANLLHILIKNGLYTELVQIPPPQPTQAQANQSNIVTVGSFCFNKPFVPPRLLDIQSSSFPPCGQSKRQNINIGGTVQVTTTQTDKFDDRVINTDTKSQTKQTITTTNSVLPITGRDFKVYFRGIGEVAITFELRSPNGFLSYLGSWYKVSRAGGSSNENVLFGRYDTVPARTIFNGGPYLAIRDGLSASCYSWVNYDGGLYCVPMDATHTSMLMDIAVILRNLNISPTDLNAPVSVRVTN